MQLRHAKKVLNFRATVATSRGEFCSRESIVVELVGDGGDCGRGEIAPWQGFGCEEISAAEEILTTMEAGVGATRHQLENFLRDRESVAKFPCTAHALSAAKFFLENPQCFLAPEPPRAETAQLIFREPATMPEDVAEGILRQSREPPPTQVPPPTRSSPLTQFSPPTRLPATNPCPPQLPPPTPRGDFPAVFKVKIGFGEPATEAAFCEKILSIVARQSPATKLRFDANGKWRDASALSQFSRAFAFPQLEFLEQPLAATKPNDEFIFALPPPLSAKIALDESLRAPWRVPDDWAGVAVVKPLLAGDFAKIRAWLSRQCGARFVISTVFESDVGRAALRFLIAENRRNKRRLASGISRA